jgi:diaminopropionate ammonia-lyase
VYVPAGSPASVVDALRGEGADVVVTDVGYDDTVRLMARDAASRGWTIVSDTSWEGYEEIPRWIMAGYTRLMDEAAAQWGDSPPDVVIVQAGVGSLAGAVAAMMPGVGFRRANSETDSRYLVIAEPEGSACVQASVRAGRRVSLDSCAPTAMLGLKCAEVSPLAWRALEGRVDAAIGVSEAQVRDAMTRLASPLGGDPAIHAGPSGACGVAALFALMRDPALASTRASLGLGSSSRVLAIVTERG